MSKSHTTKIGRSAVTGKFVPVQTAIKHPRTNIVQTIKAK